MQTQERDARIANARDWKFFTLYGTRCKRALARVKPKIRYQTMKSSKKQLTFLLFIISISCLGVYIEDAFYRYVVIFGLYACMAYFLTRYFKSSDKLTIGTLKFFKIQFSNISMLSGAIVFSIGIIGIRYELINSGTKITFSNFYYLLVVIPFLLSLIRINPLKR